MTTTVVYAQAESGWGRKVDTVYLDAARDVSPDAEYAGPTNVSAFVGQQLSGADYNCYQSYLEWDTSAVGADTVSAVTLAMEGTTDNSDDDFTADAFEYDWGSTLTVADYRDSDAGLPALTRAAYFESSGFSDSSGYNNSFTSESAALTAINGSGDTRWILASRDHVNETVPTGNAYLRFYCTGAGNSARLTVTHAPATGEHVPPDADLATGSWGVTPLWSKVDDDPASPDATVITDTTV